MKKSSFLPIEIIAGAAVAFAATGSLFAADEINRSDKSFVQSAYEDGLAEVKMGELGLAKTANAEVKTFAQHMVDDHGKANTEIKAFADARNITVATSPTLVAQGKSKMIDAKSGGDFDKAFAEGMVNDHKKAVDAFEKASAEAKDPELKAFIDKTLPVLKMHLSMAEDLKKKVGGE
jgi:putative membrane protein